MKYINNPIFVRLSGGLGNQLFQLSAALKLSKNMGSDKVFLDLRFLASYETPRSFELGFLTNQIEAIDILSPRHSIEQLASKYRLSKVVDGVLFSRAFLSSQHSVLNLDYTQRFKSIVLDGYFQDPTVLDLNDMRSIFSGIVNDERSKVVNLVSSNTSVDKFPLIGVHIRRGDFVNQNAASKRFTVIDYDYYLRALEHFPTNAKYLVFSDDQQTAAKFSEMINAINVVELGLSLQQEFLLFTACEGFIIANSTFSWWASTLGYKEGVTVVAPRYWYKEKSDNLNNRLLLPHFKFVS